MVDRFCSDPVGDCQYDPNETVTREGSFCNKTASDNNHFVLTEIALVLQSSCSFSGQGWDPDQENVEWMVFVCFALIKKCKCLFLYYHHIRYKKTELNGGLIYIINARDVVGEEERVVACDQEQLIDNKHPSAERGVEVVGLVVL